MPRRLLLPLLAALALLCAAATAASAAPPPWANAPDHAGPPASRPAGDAVAAQDPADELDEDVPGEEDVCDPALDEEAFAACEEDVFDDEDDVVELCDDEGWGDEDQWSDEDEQLADEDDAAVASASQEDEECWVDEDEDALAPLLTGLRATVSGQGRRQRVRVAFRLDEAGTVRLTLERVSAGASAKRCAPAAAAAAKGKPAKAGSRGKGRAKGKGKKAKGCGRPVALAGSRQVAGAAGANETVLGRRWNGRSLPAGGYRITATPLGADAESVSSSFALGAPAR